ncbi:YqzM family protein [Marinicrinis lubricantis]|uniref:YqzM family protein n=1 Tax=Marinicrinis lubricantis TaxID=2086470 RepID=A0ABW1IUK1_9BACL
MSNSKNPELHINEEPRNDFLDVAVGFGVTFGFFFVVCVIFTIIAYVYS